jgi:hypothetical protein
MIAEITTKCSYKIHTRRTGYLFTLTARWLSVPRSNTRPQSIGRNTYGCMGDAPSPTLPYDCSALRTAH